MGDRSILSAAVIALVAATPALAQTAGFKEQADAVLAAAYPADGPGASVVVTEHDKVIYAGVRGLADLTDKRPITPQTVFRFGSITKQFAAAVVLQLAAEGRLKLTDPISRYLPGYPRPGGDATIAQLLSHTGGIPNYTAIPGWMVEANIDRAYTTEQMIAVFKDLPASSKPGEKWQYSNSGYILIGALIEAVTRRPWPAEVERRILRPLGLKTIRYGVDEARIPAMAAGYTPGVDGPTPAPKPAIRINMTVPGAAGALVGTAEDLARWGYALHHGKVVPATYYAQMIAPTALPDGGTAPYGFGLGLSKVRGVPAIGHDGGIPGFASDSVYVPSADVFVAILTNADDAPVSPGAVMNRLAAMAIGKPYRTFASVPLDPAAAAPFLDTYVFEDARRVLGMRDGRLYAQREGGGPSEVFSAGNGRYFYGPVSPAWFDLRRDAAGKPVMAFHAEGADAETLGSYGGAAAVAVSVPHAVLAAYVGLYAMPVGKATIALSAADQLTIQLPGQPPFVLRAVSDREFTVDSVGAKISFVSVDGRVTALTLVQNGHTMSWMRD